MNDADPIPAVFQHHCKVMSDDGKPRQWRLTEGLKTKIKKRLETFTPEDMMVAATKLSLSPWHRGDNPSKTEYCDPMFLYRSDEQVNIWLNKKGIEPSDKVIDNYYASLRTREGAPLTQREIEYLRMQDEAQAKAEGKFIVQIIARRMAERESK